MYLSEATQSSSSNSAWFQHRKQKELKVFLVCFIFKDAFSESRVQCHHSYLKTSCPEASEAKFGQLSTDVKSQKETANHPILVSDCQGSLPIIKRITKEIWIKYLPLSFGMGWLWGVGWEGRWGLWS